MILDSSINFPSKTYVQLIRYYLKPASTPQNANREFIIKKKTERIDATNLNKIFAYLCNNSEMFIVPIYGLKKYSYLFLFSVQSTIEVR